MTPVLGYHPARFMDEEDLILYADEPRLVVHVPLGFEENVYEVYGHGLSGCDAIEAVIEVLTSTNPDYTADWEALGFKMYVTETPL